MFINTCALLKQSCASAPMFSVGLFVRYSSFSCYSELAFLPIKSIFSSQGASESPWEHCAFELPRNSHASWVWSESQLSQTCGGNWAFTAPLFCPASSGQLGPTSSSPQLAEATIPIWFRASSAGPEPDSRSAVAPKFKLRQRQWSN